MAKLRLSTPDRFKQGLETFPTQKSALWETSPDVDRSAPAKTLWLSLRMKKVGVLIPAYNEEKTIAEVVKESLPFVDKVLVVNDGSEARTEKKAKKAGATVISHQKRKGKGAALSTGLSYLLSSNYEFVITLDGDGQHNPDEIPKFLNAGKDKKVGIVVGFRKRSLKNMPLDRFLTNWFTSSLVSILCQQRIPDTQCGFRLIKKKAIEGIRLYTSHFDTESEILIKVAKRRFKIKSVPIRTIYREERSKIRPLIDTLRFFKLLFSSLLPRKE